MVYKKAIIAIPNVTGNIVVTVTTMEHSSYTNLANPSSPDWLTNYRLGSSGSPSAQEGKTVSNYIPCTAGDVVYFYGTPSFDTTSVDRVTLRGASDVNEGTYFVNAWEANPHDHQHGWMEKLGEQYYAMHVNTNACVSLRASFTTPEDTSSVIITVNEPII